MRDGVLGEDRARVILHDDNKNTFKNVINSLAEHTHYDDVCASLIAKRVHESDEGKATVFEGTEDVAKKVLNKLRGEGLTVKIKHNSQ